VYARTQPYYVSKNILSKDMKMTGKLEGLVIPVLDPLGYPHGWAGETAKRIQDAVPGDCGQLVLTSTAISDVLTCGGLWQGKEVATPVPEHVFWLRRNLTHNITMEYLEHAVVWGPQKPIDFVHEYLTTEVNFDPLTATWLFLQNEFERTELANELAMAIAYLLEAWPQITDGTQVTFGPVLPNLSVGGVVLEANHIDVTFGDHRLGVEVMWPGAVLVRLVPGTPSPQELEEMQLGAVVHALATGCPPQRLVVFGLGSGKGIGMDVERDWLEMGIGGVIAAVEAIANIRNDRGVVVAGGEHCVQCPFSDSCDVSEADEYPF
jgi:hypothetical protein